MSALEYMFEGGRMTSRDAPKAPQLPDEVAVKRSDPVYNAHAYLTKVPVSAIEPFLEAFTEPGDVVLDMYAGSGMTGVAAAMHGRDAELRDISVLGQHIGSNYVNLLDAEALQAGSERVIEAVQARLGDVYATRCGDCGEAASLSRTVWTFVYECPDCGEPVSFYRAFEAAKWEKAEMCCQSCRAPFSARYSKRIAEEPVLDTVSCPCAKRLRDQDHSEPLNPCVATGVSRPDVAIEEHRQMFQASALKKHGLSSTGAFFSDRNLTVLAALRESIAEVKPRALRQKLLFAFTAILTRASKRYQWHPKRPLNAANQNYYIAPVFYEWNVFDLFSRKVQAAARSDAHFRERMASLDVSTPGSVNYGIGSADALDLADGSVDYVFTDPPFGSNIFYSDMNLFQEVWLKSFTDHESEAVIDRAAKNTTLRTAERYEVLIANSLAEAQRVLRPGGWLSLVFSNSSGEIWALLQRSIVQAGFALREATLLNKGQRSVKGLASGFENVVTMDLILSMQKVARKKAGEIRKPPDNALDLTMSTILEGDRAVTPSHVYLGVVRHYLRQNWDVSELHIGDVAVLLDRLRYDVDAVSGQLTKLEREAA
jgi:16S rRNA G966 N2-methylase RsmD